MTLGERGDCRLVRRRLGEGGRGAGMRGRTDCVGWMMSNGDRVLNERAILAAVFAPEGPIVRTGNGESKNPRWRCSYCALEFSGAKTRTYGHIAGGVHAIAGGTRACDKVGSVNKHLRTSVSAVLIAIGDRKRYARELRMHEQEVQALNGSSEVIGIEALYPPGGQSVDSTAPKRQRQASIRKMTHAKDDVDTALVIGFIAAGVPLNCLRHLRLREAFVKISSNGPGYVPPSAEKARTTLARKAAHVSDEAIAPILAGADTNPGTICGLRVYIFEG